ADERAVHKIPLQHEPTSLLFEHCSNESQYPTCHALASISRAKHAPLPPGDHHSRLTNSSPSSFLIHSTMGLVLRKARIARSSAAGSPFPSVATATTASHPSL